MSNKLFLPFLVLFSAMLCVSSQAQVSKVSDFAPIGERKPIQFTPLAKEELLNAVQSKFGRKLSTDELDSVDNMIEDYNALERMLNKFGHSLRSDNGQIQLSTLPVDKVAVAEQIRLLSKESDTRPFEKPLAGYKPEFIKEDRSIPEISTRDLRLASQLNPFINTSKNSTPIVSWVGTVGGIPEAAVSGGHFSNGAKGLVCRVFSDYGARIGYMATDGLCHFAQAGREETAPVFEVLIGDTTFANFRRPNPQRFEGAVSTNSMVAGPAYICRAQINGNYLTGFAFNNDACFIGASGVEMKVTEEFQFLYLEAAEAREEEPEGSSTPSGPVETISEQKPYNLCYGDKSNAGVCINGLLTKTFQAGQGLFFDTSGSIVGYLLGHEKEILNAKANLGIVFNQPVKAAIDVKLLGKDIWQLNEQSTLVSFNKEIASFRFEQEIGKYRFFVGPVPVSVSLSIAGEAGLNVQGRLKATSIEASLTPHGKANAIVRAAIDVVLAEAGIEGDLLLIEKQVTFGGHMEFRIDPKFRPVLVRRTYIVDNSRMLDGKVSLYADILGKRVGELVLFDWRGLSFSKVLHDEHKATIIRF